MAINEKFNTVSDFLLNPEHSNKIYNQLIEEFEASGGKLIGVGKNAKVFEHPSWSYVLKTFTQDQFYITFARFAYRKPMPAFPNFYGPPKRILPFYLRNKKETNIYIVMMEKLKPLNREIANIIIDNFQLGIAFVNDKDNNREHKVYSRGKTFTEKVHKKIFDILKQYPSILLVFQGLSIILNNKLQGSKGRFDPNPNNFMQRDNGEIVIIDPLWGGSKYKPYNSPKPEIDNLEPPHPNVIGGKYPIKPRRISNVKRRTKKRFGRIKNDPKVPLRWF